jgi:hypothetical protein
MFQEKGCLSLLGNSDNWYTDQQDDGNEGRVAQLGEHLLCKHAFISPKSLNRRLFIVQTPLQVGLRIGLQKVRVACDSMKYGGPDAPKSIRAVSHRTSRAS